MEVDPDEIDPYYDRTFKRLAQDVKIPGFRKGKVPRSVLEARLGNDSIKHEVLEEALFDLYSQAAEKEALKPITYPKIDVNSYEIGERLTFTATVEVLPEFTLPDYRGIDAKRPSSRATPEEVDVQIDRLRERFGTLESVGRNATAGDYLTIDLFSYMHDEKVDDASAEDLLYEVGSGGLIPELDSELEGKRTGDILQFNGILPERFGPPHGGKEVTFRVVVKDVQAKRLPEVDDEFAKTASEYDSLQELREDIERRIEEVKRAGADLAVRNSIVEDLLARVEIPTPESMVSSETENRIASLLRDLKASDVSLEEYLTANEMSQEQLVDANREIATKTVAADLLLEAVAEAEGIKVEREDVDSEVRAIAARVGKTPDEVLKSVAEAGKVGTLAGDILRRKALEVLVEQASITEEE